MYGDQCGEFGCGSWGLKSYVTMVTIRTTEMRSSKKQLRIWFRLEKTTNLHVPQTFFYISLPSLHDHGLPVIIRSQRPKPLRTPHEVYTT